MIHPIAISFSNQCDAYATATFAEELQKRNAE
jgi:hypothetical protein